jgi:hypothetical protein
MLKKSLQTDKLLDSWNTSAQDAGAPGCGKHFTLAVFN